MFRLQINNQDIFYDHFTFPGGEEHIKIKHTGMPVYDFTLVAIKAHIKSSGDLITLGLLVDAIRRLPLTSTATKFVLDIPYFPYARQDRVCAWGEPLSVAFVARYINMLNFDEVNVVDPHSDAIGVLINNVSITEMAYPFRDYLGWFIRGNNAVIVSPDAGAAKKTEKLSLMLGGIPIVYGRKQRNVNTGEITGVAIDDPSLITGRAVVVVDDICDGGRTFVELGKVLKEHNPKSLTLYVTHGIFSKGLSVFDGIYDAVYSHNVWWENVTADALPNELYTNEQKGRVK